jgi:serine/threonine protein kinase
LLKARQKFGKYRILKRIAEGGFACVYKALDTVEGVPVALKVPHSHLLDRATLELFRQEVRLTARLDHPSILPIKNAQFIEKQFVIVYPLGQSTLAERMRRRMTMEKTLGFAEQMLEAVSFAHRHRVIHCDLKPENFILFAGDRLRLADFGISKVAMRTLSASGSGTLGYLAPEQALGKPSFRSDVFSLGLILYRMLSGHLPDWPFLWPPRGVDKVKRKLHPDALGFLKRSMELFEDRRYTSATHMLAAFARLKRERRLLPSRSRTRASRARRGRAR